MLFAMGGDDFVRWLMLPADQMLREMKFSEKFISEVVSLATRVNYGQDPDMEGFAGIYIDHWDGRLFSISIPRRS